VWIAPIPLAPPVRSGERESGAQRVSPVEQPTWPVVAAAGSVLLSAVDVSPGVMDGRSRAARRVGQATLFAVVSGRAAFRRAVSFGSGA
jgi:hypothetical protein